VGIERVVRYAGERHTQVLAHGPRRQRDLQFSRDGLSVLIERLIEIAETEKKYGVRIAALDV